MKALITVGVSASGKSTWAREVIGERLGKETWFEINRDFNRWLIQEEKGLTNGSRQDGVNWAKWNWKWEKEVNKMVDENLAIAVEHEANVIVSDTNLNADRLEASIKRLDGLGYSVEVKTFPISFEEAVKRDAARPNGVGYAVLAKQFEQWNAMFAKRYTGTPGRPKTVIVDVDGTLARMDGRGPFDWSKVGEDKPNQFVIDVVRGLYREGYTIIVMSGRDGICYDETHEWLDLNSVPYDEHLQRRASDQRADTVIKEELFWQHVADCYDVKFVIDDRPVMIRKWREMGIETMAVGNQLINF